MGFLLQGTEHFFAQELLGGKRLVRQVYHELEAFYWVLIWMIMFHLEAYHGYIFRFPQWPYLFQSVANNEASVAKYVWLTRFDADSIIENPPLAELATAFNHIVLDSISTHRNQSTGPTRVTYASVLALFDAAVARTDWPDEPRQDTASTLSPEVSTLAIADATDHTKSDEVAVCKRKYEEDSEDAPHENAGSVEVENRGAKRCKQDA